MPIRRMGVVAVVVVLLAGCSIVAPVRPPGREAEAPRGRARNAVQQLAADVSRAGGPTIAEARFDECDSGAKRKGALDEDRLECHVAHSVLLTAAATDDELPGQLRRMAHRLHRLGCRPSGEDSRGAQSQWRRGRLARHPVFPQQLRGYNGECRSMEISLRPVDRRPCLPPEDRRDYWCLEQLLDTEGTELFGDLERSNQPYPDDAADRARASGDRLFWIVTADACYHLEGGDADEAEEHCSP